MDPLVNKVAARARTARLQNDPEALYAQMKKSVEALLEARVEMRRVWEALSEIQSDASGMTFTDNYNDDEIRRVYKGLYELDHSIGEGFRNIEWIERVLKKKQVK